MIKRVFITFFLLIFICSIISIPAFAADLDYNSSVNVVDFLSTDAFTVTGSATGDGESVEEIFFTTTTDNSIYDEISYKVQDEFYHVQYDQLQHLSITWRPLKVAYSSKLYFYFTNVDATFSLKVNGVSYRAEHSHSSSMFRAYYINLPNNSPLIKEITVEFTARTTTFNNAPGIVSCFGSNTVMRDFTSGWMSGEDFIWYESFNEAYDGISVSRQETMPEHVFTPGDGETGVDNWFISAFDFPADGYASLISNVSIVVDLRSLGPDHLDTFMMNFDAMGDVLSIDAYIFSAFDDRPDTTLTALPVDHIYAGFSQMDLTFPNGEIKNIEADGHSCFIDISNIDIINYRYLCIDIGIEPVDSDREGSTYSYLGVLSMSGGYSLEHDTFETRVLFNMSTITSYLRQYLSSIADSLASPDGSSEMIEEGKEVMQQQSSQVNDLNNTLDNVPKEDIDIDSVLGNSLSFNPTGIGFLATVTNNKYITAILTLVFTLALVGYIFFGKR